MAQEASPAALEDLPAPDMAASSGATGKDGGWRFRVPEDSSTPIPLKRVLFLRETPAAMGALQRRYGAGECCGGRTRVVMVWLRLSARVDEIGI